MPSVALHTLGCKLNFADTNRLAREFESRQYTVITDGGPADVTVINSCSVTEEADRKCRQLVRRSVKANPETFVIVTGCYAQLQPGELAGVSGVDLVLGMKDKFRIFDVVSSFVKQEKTQVEVSCIDDVNSFEPSHSTARTRTFVKIQDGCDYSCSFCTIPMARGGSRSERIALVVERVRSLADAGAREVVLSGVNLGLFGADTGESLLQLFSELDAVTGIRRYRISSIEPNLLSDEIVDFVADSRSFVHHFHVPLQSGDDEVLGAMRRRYQTADYADRVKYILDRCPNACIGADVIVGFPAETNRHFLNTFNFVRELPLAYLHVFSYSTRPDTVAGDRVQTGLVEQIDKRERSRRNGIMRSLSESKRRAFYESHLGRTATVLWEGRPVSGRDSQGPDPLLKSARRMFGHTDNYVRVQSAYDPGRLRKFDSVRLLAIDDRDAALSVVVEPA